jgi:hypothetical protein
MLLWALTLSPTPGQLMLGLALALAVLILAAAAGVATTTSAATVTSASTGRHDTMVRPRLADPDAAGRPRPRAPTAYPTAA